MLNQNISRTSNHNLETGETGNQLQNLSISLTDNKSPKYKKKQDSDDFEELGETREIIEDRIFRLKLQMVNLTIT